MQGGSYVYQVNIRVSMYMLFTCVVLTCGVFWEFLFIFILNHF